MSFSAFFFTQRRRSQRLGPLSQELGCWGACTRCCAGWGGWSSAGRGWESGYLWAWTGCLGPGAGPGLAEAGGWVNWAGVAVEVEGAAVAGRSDPGRLTRTRCSCRPARGICLSVGAARSYSKWGRLCSGWRRSGSSVDWGPPRTRCRCPVEGKKIKKTGWFTASARDDSAVFPCGAVRDAEAINVNEQWSYWIILKKGHQFTVILVRTTHTCTHTRSHLQHGTRTHGHQKWSKMVKAWYIYIRKDDLLLKRAL